MSKGEETKKRILKSALNLFSTKGYEMTSIRDIAIEVNIKAPSIYAYYSSKEALFVSVCDFVMENYVIFIRSHSSTISHLSIENKLYALLKSLNDYFYENELGHFINRYFILPPDPFKEVLLQQYIKSEVEIKKILFPILSAESDKFIAIDTIIASFFSNLDGMLVYMINFSRDDYEKRLRECWEVFWRGIQKHPIS